MTSQAIGIALFDHLERSSQDQSTHQAYHERIDFVRAAEQGGFVGYHLAEHHATPLSQVPSPALFLSALASHTTKIRIGAMVFLLPFYEPLRLLNEIKMLDQMSNGRLDLGVGRGINPIEHAYFNMNLLESADRYKEALEVILQGMSGTHLNYKGEYYRYLGVPILDMAPVQAPCPPLWVGAVSPDSMRRAARQGMNVCTNGTVDMVKNAIAAYRAEWGVAPEESLQPHVTSPKLGVQRFVYVGATDAEAESTARAGYDYFLGNINKLYSYFGLEDKKVVHSFDKIMSWGGMICGTADKVADMLSSQIEESGANYLMANMNFGALSYADARRSLDRFVEDVMPQLSDTQSRSALQMAV
ncbi:LLM class flavin-dependent oxidoreductase [Sinorhizobium meliloti]|uniref:LLM class flavin-dependent oxidoreductase n=1 Tax=Rhizobium meliloti TaxID=382 RepID=UPI003F1583EB